MNTSELVRSVLVVSTSERRFELQRALHDSLHIRVSVAASFKEALATIALSPHQAVILDEGMADLEPASANDFLAHCNDALPIFVKLAITGVPRCVQQVQLAFRRFDKEQRIATVAVQHSINSQLRDALTAIMIHSQLAVSTLGEPQEALRHLESVIEGADAVLKAIGQKKD